MENELDYIPLAPILMPMATITMMLKSRTFWTIVAMFLIGGVQAIQSIIPSGALIYVEGVLGLMATYFKLNPSQNYGSPA